MNYWIYFDASALVKRYSHENGTQLVNEVFRLLSPSRMTCSGLGILEIVSILVRKRNDGRLDQQLFSQAMVAFKVEVIDSPEFMATPVDNTTLFSALELIEKHNLNSTDAIILRSIINLQQFLRQSGDELMLWTSDKRLSRAAQAEGIIVFDPEIETISHLHHLLST